MCIRDRSEVLNTNLSGLTVEEINLPLIQKIKKETVSYTHLDVYKRQTLLDVFKGIPQDDYTTVVDSSAVAPVVANLKEQYPISSLQDFNQLVNLYLCDSDEVKRTPEDLNAAAFMEKDFTTDLSGAEPKILIFHTHGTEG